MLLWNAYYVDALYYGAGDEITTVSVLLGLAKGTKLAVTINFAATALICYETATESGWKA